MAKKTIKIDPKYKPQNKTEFNQCLKSRLWRLHNLYTVKDERAELVPFVPRQEQLYLLHNMHTRNVILKVRQLGISTFWLIYMLDACLFYPAVETGCIAHHREDAQELFENKVKLAYDNLPKEIQNMHKQTSDSARKLAFSNGSSIRIGTSFRSGTPVIVLVSEFGKIAANYPQHALEIETGTFNAVPSNGILVVESTAQGQEGAYYEMVRNARQAAAESRKLNPYDFKFFFFDWVSTPKYTLDARTITVSQELDDYFNHKETEIGKKIPKNKRAWYAAKSGNRLSSEMKREFPTTPDEAFEESIEGAFFVREMFEARKAGRIRRVSPDKNHLVDTVWDLGYSDSTFIIWFQVLGPTEVLIFDCYENHGESLHHYAKILDQKREEHDIRYGQHYAPHDVAKHSLETGTSLDDYAHSLGIRFTTLQKANLKQDLIEAARRTIPKCYIDEKRADKLIKCLDNHRKERKAHTGAYTDKPRKDWTSHGADCLEYLAYAVENFGGSTNTMTAGRAHRLFEENAPPPC